MKRHKQFADGIEWWKLRPDMNHEFMTGSYGEYGKVRPAGQSVLSKTGDQITITSPDRSSSGDADWVLVIEKRRS